MPTTPTDLADLEHDRQHATTDLTACSSRVTAEHQAPSPDPEQWEQRAIWLPEQACELERLRGGEQDLVMGIHRHPAVPTTARRRLLGRRKPLAFRT